MFYDLFVNMQTEGDPGETNGNEQACCLVWPWPLPGVDIFQCVIEMASQAVSMIYNPVATVCQRTHVALKAWHAAANHLWGILLFHSCWEFTKLLTHIFPPTASNLTLYWSKSPGIACLCCILPTKKKKKRNNNDEEPCCESASKQPEFTAHEGNSSLSF